MIRAIIVDDEEDARVILRSYLSMYCDTVEVVGEANGVNTGLHAIQTLKPDLVFLDVRLSPGSSFDILHNLEDIDFDIVFTTAHDEYAVKAIRFSAIDYLLKPIDIDELIAAVSKAGGKKREESRKVRYDIFRENLNILNEQYGRIVLPTMDGFVVVEVKNIVRCEADRNYTQFFFADGKKIVIPRTLKIYDELLGNLGFFRAHQSHLINLQQVTEYKRRKKGGIAILRDQTEIPVAENRKDDFIRRFNPM
ncbi:MAG: LytTR family DNA-binding domain-containing protein [Bacteroidia bacterium]